MKKVISLITSASLLITPALATPEVQNTKLSKTENRFTLTQHSNTLITRGEAVQLLYETLGKPKTYSNNPFIDVTDNYSTAVCWAVQENVIKGIGNGYFAPNALLTNQELAVMLYHLCGSPNVSGLELSQYQDSEEISAWAKDAIIWCVKTGILPKNSSTLLTPKDNFTKDEFSLVLEHFNELPEITVLKQDLETLTAIHRPIGSDGEKMAVNYLQTRFTEMGYVVSLQQYTDKNGKTGTNVIATRLVDNPDADILVISAHHDSVPTAYGANDNASGVIALLALADAMKNVPTDTELRFISFTDEENGKNGSRYYTNSLTESERNRMIGDIELDMIGGLGTTGLAVYTMDGEPNWLSELILKKDKSMVLGAETSSDHASFQLAEIPSVLIMQNGRGYLYHSASDSAEYIDLFHISHAVSTISSVIKNIASNETSSYYKIAKEQASGYTYKQTRQNVIYFSSSLSESEAYIGAVGTLVDSRKEVGNGWTDTYDTYLYPMRWFNGENPMNTYYIYRNGFLERIEIKPEETGYTLEQVRTLLWEMYGKPTRTNTTNDGVVKENWADEIYSKYISLDCSKPCTVTVSKYSVGITNVLASYPVSNGKAEITDIKYASVWEYLCSILPEETRLKIGKFNLFTDGYSNILAYTSPMKHEDGSVDNTRFSINIDYYDVYDENGVPRDWSKLTYTILHEYGHVLLEDETQVDLSIGSGTHDPAGFILGSFRKNFYDSFWKDGEVSGVNNYNENPTHYVSRYGANYFHEDITDTFALFVLSNKPQGNTIAEEKIRFFWDYPNMVELRNKIRENMGLSISEMTDSEVSKSPLTKEDIYQQFINAMTNLNEEVTLDVNGITWQFGAENDLKNIYYSILSDHPELKYAYDMKANVLDNTASCKFSYMPYKTKDYKIPAGSHTINSLHDAKVMAQSMNNGTKELSIAITNPLLEVDDIQLSLAQAGYGWFRFSLNSDGTKIIASLPLEKSIDDCVTSINESFKLCQEILSKIPMDNMTEREKIEAVYDYVTKNVTYDFRYYSDRNNMPYESMVALGALRDGTAICGGYSQAFEMLLDMLGIENYTVSGISYGENHMWNYIILDGNGYYCDPTADRGGINKHFMLKEDEFTSSGRYSWNSTFLKKISGFLQK